MSFINYIYSTGPEHFLPNTTMNRRQHQGKSLHPRHMFRIFFYKFFFMVESPILIYYNTSNIHTYLYIIYVYKYIRNCGHSEFFLPFPTIHQVQLYIAYLYMFPFPQQVPYQSKKPHNKNHIKKIIKHFSFLL